VFSAFGYIGLPTALLLAKKPGFRGHPV